MKKIYLVDVSSMFFRAFYAVRPLTSANGVPVNAVYGFISMIVKLLKEKNPEYIVFCYDRKEPSFRKELDENYKANRTEMPDDLQVQMPYIKKVASLFGITDLEVPGYEADDLIGTLSREAYQAGYESYIVSGDKDFCQLINDKTFIYDTMKEFLTTEKGVVEKYGVTAKQFRDYLAITGDTSDNIPGVSGIGPKGAQKLISEFDNLENIYQNIDKISSAGIKQKLNDSKDQAFLSQKLVTIVTDVKHPLSLEDFKRQDLKRDQLRAFFKELNFKTFEKNILDDEPKEASVQIAAEINTSSSEVSVLALDWDLQKIMQRLKSEKSFWFLKQNFVGIGFGMELYFEEIEKVKNIFNELNMTSFHWAGFDVKSIWRKLNLEAGSIHDVRVIEDLMLEAYLLRGNDCTDYDDLFKRYLNIEVKSKDSTVSEVYERCLRLQRSIHDQVNEDHNQMIYKKLDLPLVKILFRMENLGVKIDIKKLQDMSVDLETQIRSAEEKIFGISGETFNVSSPKQLGVVLFEKMGLPALKKTKTGYSTDNEVLESLKHPIAAPLIEYRELTKLKSTYVDALPDLADQSQRLHTHFEQALTATGRLSSTDPNLQNIPIKTPRGQMIRRCFISESGHKLLCLDYSQIELRVLAHISEDKNLIKAFSDGLDIHTATAAEVFGVKVSEVTKEQRRIAKAVNFGIAYGQGAFGLAETLGISRTESKDIIDRYFKKYHGIKDYINSTIELAHKNKYVETIFGRRRYLPELSSSQVMIKKFGERAAINAPIQGTASDLVRLAMIDISRSCKLDMLLQIHDELMFEGTTEAIEEDLKLIIYKMENVAKLKVPLKVNYSIGDNWDESH